jgi:glycosyltransferase involved in cell wall biosynthesis
VSLVHAPTLLFPPRGGRPLVVTIHDAVPWTHPETLTGRGVRWHRRMAARAARTADLLVVPTRAVRDELARRLPIGERTLVVGEGVPARLVVPPDADARAARLGLPTGGYLAMVGTLEPRKGLDVLLAALARRSAPALPLFVAGPTGWGRPVAVALAERLGLSRRVHLLGRLDDPDLAVLTARATASVLPSRAEGFGLPLLEAMHLGTPVVASDVPALVEVAGGAALCVPVGDPQALADALSRVAGDAALRESLSRAGRLRAGAYSWEAAARTLWAAYVGLLTPRA